MSCRSRRLPVSVKRCVERSRSCRSINARSRPTKLVNWTGRLWRTVASMTCAASSSPGRRRYGLTVTGDRPCCQFELDSLLRREPQGIDQVTQGLAARPSLRALKALDTPRTQATALGQRLLRQAGSDATAAEATGQSSSHLATLIVSVLGASLPSAVMHGWPFATPLSSALLKPSTRLCPSFLEVAVKVAGPRGQVGVNGRDCSLVARQSVPPLTMLAADTRAGKKEKSR